MDLTNFPMDSLVCELVFESYSYSTSEVELSWLPKSPVSIPEGTKFQLPDFEFHHINWSNSRNAYTAGMWDQLVVQFYFRVSFVGETSCNHKSIWLNFRDASATTSFKLTSLHT